MYRLFLTIEQQEQLLDTIVDAYDKAVSARPNIYFTWTDQHFYWANFARSTDDVWITQLEPGCFGASGEEDTIDEIRFVVEDVFLDALTEEAEDEIEKSTDYRGMHDFTEDENDWFNELWESNADKYDFYKLVLTIVPDCKFTLFDGAWQAYPVLHPVYVVGLEMFDQLIFFCKGGA
jgi:hypothetical protein